MEMSNPGSLLISFNQLIRGGVSECRNKSLQVMFQMLGLGEKAGSSKRLLPTRSVAWPTGCAGPDDQQSKTSTTSCGLKQAAINRFKSNIK